MRVRCQPDQNADPLREVRFAQNTGQRSQHLLNDTVEKDATLSAGGISWNFPVAQQELDLTPLRESYRRQITK